MSFWFHLDLGETFPSGKWCCLCSGAWWKVWWMEPISKSTHLAVIDLCRWSNGWIARLAGVLPCWCGGWWSGRWFGLMLAEFDGFFMIMSFAFFLYGGRSCLGGLSSSGVTNARIEDLCSWIHPQSFLKSCPTMKCSCMLEWKMILWAFLLLNRRNWYSHSVSCRAWSKWKAYFVSSSLPCLASFRISHTFLISP